MILLILIVILIVILIYLYQKKSKNIQKITFLNKNAAEKVLINTQYFNQFNKNDLMARNCSNIEECKYKYKNSILEFSKKEKLVITNYIQNKLCKISELKHQNWKFIKVRSEIENGYPHTHKDCIIIGEDFANQIIENNGSRVLIHEQIHIMQRYERNKMVNDLKQNLHFKPVKYIEGIEKYKNRIRANPDEDFNNYWIYKNKILPLCLYNKNPRNLGDVQYYGVYVKNNKIISDLIPLYNIKEYKYNALGKNNYNGFEVQAEIWENRLN